jgi:hypothetical protein
MLKAIKLRAKKKISNQEVNGRLYYYNRSNLEEGIHVLALNEPLLKLLLKERFI